jgi:hypothetical protein
MAVTPGITSAGTMVAAALETVGHYYQAHILDSLAEPFRGSLGGFIYLVGIAVAVFSVAVRGSYKFGPWLLIGPPLFFSAVFPRMTIGPVQWKFANQDRDQGRVNEEVERMMPKKAGDANVSKLFARYDEIISATVQKTVEIFNNHKTETDKTFILKAQLLSRVAGNHVEDPQFGALIGHALLNQCGAIVAAAKIYQSPFYPAQEKETAKNFLDSFDVRNLVLVDTAIDYVVRKNGQIASGSTGGDGTPDKAIISDLQSSFGGTLSTDRTVLQSTQFSCKQIWQYVTLGLLDLGRRNILRIQADLANNKVDVTKALTQLAKSLSLVPDGGDDAPTVGQAELVERLAQASAKYLLRNAADRGNLSGRIEEVAEMSREFPVVESPLEPTLFEAEYARGRSGEYAEKTRLLTTASNLPYYQGLLLYFLSIAFPFFAMLLLVPGKHMGFLMWFVLWLWVKSWDIGMAVVMQLDDILFSIMTISNQTVKDIPLAKQQLNVNFDLAMSALRLSDPTFQLTTYYNIVAASLAAIPIVSSQLILGGLSGGAGLVSQGMKMMSEDMAQGSQKGHSQAAVSNMRHDMQEIALARSQLFYRMRSGYTAPTIDAKTGKMTQRPTALPPMDPEKLRHVRLHVQTGPHARGDDIGGVVGRRRDPIRTQMDYVHLARDAQGLITGMRDPTTRGSTIRRLAGVPLPAPKGIDPMARTKELLGVMLGSDDGAGAVEKAAKAWGDLNLSIADNQIDPIAKWAMFDAVYSDRGQKNAAMARIYGMLEVPWSTDTPDLADSEFALKYHRAVQDFDAACGEVAADVTGGSLDAFTKYFLGVKK